MKTLVTLLLLSATLAAQVPGSRAHERKLRDYLPLEKGWYYKFDMISTKTGYANGSTEWTMLAARDLNGHAVNPRQVIPNAGAAFTMFLEDDGKQICVIAV